MVRHATTFALACALLVFGNVFGNARPGPTAEELAPLIKSTEPVELCLRPGTGFDEGQAGPAQNATLPYPPDWPGRDVIGGDVPAVRVVTDPFPTFDGIAIDTDNGLVAMSDENRGSLLIYDRTSGSQSTAITDPKRHIIGPHAGLGFLAGVALNPKHREIITVSNDGGGFSAFSYDDHGDAKPLRKLEVPHQSWGLSLDLINDEMAITSQQYQGISFFARDAAGTPRPKRTIRGLKTMLSDPHGVIVDAAADEVFTANHGNWTEMRSYADDVELLPGEYVPGRFEKPSIRVHKASLDGNIPPHRTIQGPQTQLAWPMGITLDTKQNELVVANYGTNNILFYPKSANGDVAPSRVLGGPLTLIVGPVGVVVDPKNDELWIANYGDHTALVFDRTASGNAAPKRIIRNAPAGTPTTGFTNASAAAYDSKRDELLVPN